MSLFIRYSLYQTVVYLFVCVRNIDLHSTFFSRTPQYGHVLNSRNVNDYNNEILGRFSDVFHKTRIVVMWRETELFIQQSFAVRLQHYFLGHRPQRPHGLDNCWLLPEINNNLLTLHPFSSVTAFIHMKVEYDLR
jgi:hypothetical protein